jgi:hypothetical protein
MAQRIAFYPVSCNVRPFINREKSSDYLRIPFHHLLNHIPSPFLAFFPQHKKEYDPYCHIYNHCHHAFSRPAALLGEMLVGLYVHCEEEMQLSATGGTYEGVSLPKTDFRLLLAVCTGYDSSSFSSVVESLDCLHERVGLAMFQNFHFLGCRNIENINLSVVTPANSKLQEFCEYTLFDTVNHGRRWDWEGSCWEWAVKFIYVETVSEVVNKDRFPIHS